MEAMMMMTTFLLPPLLESPESELPFRRSTDEGLVEVNLILEVEAEAAVAAAVITTTADLLDIVDAAPVAPLHPHRGREIEIDEIQAEVFRQVHVVVDAIDLEVGAEEEEEEGKEEVVALESALVEEVVVVHAPARNSGPDGLALTVEIGGDDAREVGRMNGRRGTTEVEVEVAVVLVEIGIEMRVAAAADVGQAQVPIEGKTGLAKVRAVEGRRQGGTPKLRRLLLLW